jgi:c-di-GMP-binding flagellar brake protein YcgR
MLKERRRYFRQPVKMPVRLVVEGRTLNATSTNVSEGGIAIILREALPKGAVPRVKFCLPHMEVPIEVEAEVAWTDLKGHAGLRFHRASAEAQQQLARWLDARIEEDSPRTKDSIAADESHLAERGGFQPPPHREN